MSQPVEPGRAVGRDTTVAGSRIRRLFDLRLVIGGLMGIYGVVLVVRGLVDGPEQLARAAGTAINLWTGIGLVVVAGLFLLWARVRPLGIEGEIEDDT